MVFRTFKSYYKDIYFEFAVHEEKRDTIILLPGFPSYHNLKDKLEFLYNQGYNVFFPRYKGSYQSRGYFLEENPAEYLQEFVDDLMKGSATSMYDMRKFHFEVDKLIIMGICFSGPFACGLASIDSRINKIVLFSPAWDFCKHGDVVGEQDLQKTLQFVKRAYENLYRIKFNNLRERLTSFKNTKSENYIKRISAPILVLINPKDLVTSTEHLEYISSKLKNLEIIRHNNDHGLKIETLTEEWSKIKKFLDKP